MNSDVLTARMIDALNDSGLAYMLVGSFSSNLYGIPRSTKDADFVVEFGATPVTDVTSRLGPDFELESQMSFETITGTYRYRLRHPASAFMVELFMPNDDPHDRERFARRKPMPFAGRTAYVPTVEDVIITKLRWSRQGKRDKDVEDVRAVISVSGSIVDWAYVEQWCDRHGTRDLLDRTRAEAATDGPSET